MQHVNSLFISLRQQKLVNYSVILYIYIFLTLAGIFLENQACYNINANLPLYKSFPVLITIANIKVNFISHHVLCRI